jgi:hypothetical protein
MATRWKTIAQVLTAFSLLPWVIMLMFTPMAFDSGAPTGGLAMMVGLIWAYPLIVIAAFVAAAWSSRRQRPTLAALSMSVPLLLAVALLVALNQ